MRDSRVSKVGLNVIHSNILEAIGNTPIIKLNRIGRDCGANLYVKFEALNPGGSIKDRIGIWLIEDAEKKGTLKPGGTIIEGTSGNTGFGLAIAAAIKGYHCIFVLPDKMSEEKIFALRAFGAKVIVTPTAVEPEDPRSYYSVSRRLAKETANSLYVDQYNNLANRDCHYRTTGPEILEQMPNIDVFLAGIGTGGTLCGNGRYFKEKKPDVKIVGVDPIGSIVYEYFKTGKMTPAHTYKIEGIGEDFIPANYDFQYVDDMIQVEDKESFIMARDLLTKEGIYSGISSGSAVVGALRWVEQNPSMAKDKNILIILPDSGNRYLSKLYNDDWMREAGFLEGRGMGTVENIIHDLKITPGSVLVAKQGDPVSTVVGIMREKNVSQVPVEGPNGNIKGIISESVILKAVYENRIKHSDPIDAIVNPSVEYVNLSDSVESISKIITDGKFPLVQDKKTRKVLAILTQIDLLTYLGNKR